jgi:RNA polymerase sigma-70 factor (ECF subfamily)
MGQFQLEAAIQAAHSDRMRTSVTDWRAILALYEGLISIAPSTGAYVARAAAVGEVHGAVAGLNALAAVAVALDALLPYWATRAALLKVAGQDTDAAYGKVISLMTDLRVRRFLEQKRAE